MKETNFEKQVLSCILGHATGDALGLPVQFMERYEVAENPITEMRDCDIFNVPKGSWSDDTSLTLCALESIGRLGKIKHRDIMFNFYEWLANGKFTPFGYAYDVGRGCMNSIVNFASGTPIEECSENNERNNGNGSLMRIIPFVLYCCKMSASREDFIKNYLPEIEKASILTHSHRRSQIGCGIYGLVMSEILKNPSKDSVFFALRKAKEIYGSEAEGKFYNRLFEEGFENTPIENIRSSGYVVDTLEAAVWCLLTTDSYKECLLKAVNLGLDTDTVGAVAGGLAGAFYGIDNIPDEWVSLLYKLDWIKSLCINFSNKLSNQQ